MENKNKRAEIYAHHFHFQTKDCPELISYNNSVILHLKEAKYFGLLLGRQLTWGTHLKSKRKQLYSWLELISPLLKSNMDLSHHLFLCKSFLQKIWSYRIAYWGTAKPSNLRIIQAFQSICLRMVTKALWFVTNAALHEDIKVPMFHPLTRQ